MINSDVIGNVYAVPRFILEYIEQEAIIHCRLHIIRCYLRT